MATDAAALLDGPAGVPPNGTVSQLDNPPNQWGVSHVFPVFSIVLVSLLVAVRLYTTVFVTRRVGLSDFFLALGYGFFIGFASMCLVAVRIAPGLHMWDLRLKYLASYLYYLRMGSILYAPTICWVKLSILSQYMEVFMPTKQPRLLYWTTICLMGANVISYLVLMLMQIFDCNPIRKSWDPFVVGGSCIDSDALSLSATAVNVISDTIIFILPQAVIWRLAMATKQKMGLSVMFLIAVLAIASASIRLYYSVRLMESDDVTWYSWLMGVWGLVEMDLGIIVACLPVFGAFWRSLRQSTFYTNASRSLMGITSWKKMTTDDRRSSASMQAMADRKLIDPYLIVDGDQRTPQGISWVRTYGVTELDTLATVDEPDLESSRGYTGATGYHVNVDSARIV